MIIAFSSSLFSASSSSFALSLWIRRRERFSFGPFGKSSSSRVSNSPQNCFDPRHGLLHLDDAAFVSSICARRMDEWMDAWMDGVDCRRLTFQILCLSGMYCPWDRYLCFSLRRLFLSLSKTYLAKTPSENQKTKEKHKRARHGVAMRRTRVYAGHRTT